MPRLTLRYKGLTLKEFQLAKERITIGRHSDTDIQLDDPTVSGVHAVLTLKPDAYLDGAFDVAIADGQMYLVCQKFPALVRVDRVNNEFCILRCEEKPLQYPVAVCDAGGGMILVSDPETGTVYRLLDDELEPFLTENLARPTGVAALPALGRVFVVDTGEQSLKIFDYDGRLVKTIDRDEAGEPLFNYPTFASVAVSLWTSGEVGSE